MRPAAMRHPVATSLLPALLACACMLACHAQLSAPVADDSHVSIDNNKYLQNKADLDKSRTDTPGLDGWMEEDALPAGDCPLNVQVRWMSQVSSSVYATPLITDLYSDGRKDIVVPSFVHYLEVLEGLEGAQAVGWPAFHKSSVHASPLLYDWDFDGVRDILLATYDGQVLAFKDTGEKLPEQLSVPRLKLRKNWYQKLNPETVDHSHPDVSDPLDAPPRQQGQGQGAQGQGSQGQGQGRQPPQHDESPEGGAGGSGEGGGGGGGGGVDGRPPRTLPLGGDHQLRRRPPGEASAETKVKVQEYKAKLDKYRTSYGEAAAKQLLDETRERNPSFYDLVMTELALDAQAQAAGIGSVDGGGSVGGGADGVGGGSSGRRRLMVADDEGADIKADEAQGVEAGQQTLSEEALESFEVFNDQVDGDGTDEGVLVKDEDLRVQDLQERKGADDDYKARLLAFQGEEEMASILEGVPDPSEYDEFGDSFANFDGGNQEDNADQDFHYNHLYQGDYADRNLNKFADQLWQDEEFTQTGHHQEEEFVYVDAHILTTPAIADIDGDGREELVVSVSYFFDREYYEDPAHAKDIKGIDIGKYVASGIVVFDLRTRKLKWEQHLDLSTDSTQFKAYAYASPTLIDFETDGKLEIVVGTSMGFLYVLGHDGKPRAGWPIQMGEIQGQALVIDINNDGKLEVVAADTRGNVAAFNTHGEELWARHVRSLVAQGVTAADLNGDGDLELVFGTGSGHVYAIKGSDGLDIRNFPFRTHGRIHAPILVTRLVDGPAQHAIVPSFDGYLYMIDGYSGCADTLDIGETSYSMVLADDLDGNGRLDLVLATMNGNVYALETPAEFHPLKAWPSQVMGPNSMMARHDYFGVYAAPASRVARDVAGEKLHLKIVIVDKRGLALANGTIMQGLGGPYNVSVVLKGVGVREMNAGPQPVIGVSDTFQIPGTFPIELPCPRTRTTATIHIELVDAHGQVLVDEFALSFHLHFHKLLKWLIALPPVLMALAVVTASAAAKRREEEAEEEDAGSKGTRAKVDLPTFHSHQV